ncbi:MAG: hypothetical protein JW995_09950 [Melioribacteraceae bacterium]|nr:hypothetical protein [Melioribacteraceae bacterium]
MKKYLLILIIPVVLSAQNFNGRFSSSAYTFERYDLNESSETYLRTFQSLLLNINEGQFSVRTRINFEADVMNSLDTDPRLRMYNLYLEGRNLFDIATIKIGRQSLINTVAGGVYDGANLSLKYKGFELTGFYGGNVPAYQKLEITDDFANDYVLGGELVSTAVENFRFAVGFIDKNFKPQSYEAIRLDDNFNPITVLIQRNSNQYKYISGEVSYILEDDLELNSSYEYDVNLETTSKIEFAGRYSQIENLGVNFYYNYREPRIRYNSIFSVFNYGNSQEIEAGLDYKLSDEYTVFGKFGYVKYEDDNAQRLSLGLNTFLGSVSYRKTFGYAGELDAVSLYTAKTFLEGLITPSLGLSYTSYKLSPDSEKNNLASVLLGLNVRPFRSLSFDIQGQYMDNKIYKNDLRLLFKVNHWFNTNLNVL